MATAKYPEKAELVHHHFLPSMIINATYGNVVYISVSCFFLVVFRKFGETLVLVTMNITWENRKEDKCKECTLYSELLSNVTRLSCNKTREHSEGTDVVLGCS